MRWKTILIPTLREVPKEAEATSHQLMLKAGYIRKLSSGVYSYLPLGFRALERVCQIMREELRCAGAVELLMPALHPAEIWKQTGRFDTLGADKISFKNRTGTEYVLGPTHEEIVTEIAAAYLKSHHDLPKILYQIQTKFRDELRPRFGVIRTKEFIMKDAYSFDADEAGLRQSYDKMYEAYQNILTRMGLKFDIVSADTGVMGGKVSHEFMVRSKYGEDRISVCTHCQTTTSRDIAARKIETKPVEASDCRAELFDTPDLKTIQDLTEKFKIQPHQLIKTILYLADEKPVAACVLGNREVHERKLLEALGANSIRMAGPEEIEQITGAPIGFSGPLDLKNVRIVVDGDILQGNDYVAGANRKDKHYRNVNYGRDFKADIVGDIRFVEEGDCCPKCGAELKLITAMEVGHVFQLGTRYTEALNARYRAADGSEKLIVMGCYGLGVNRILAAIIEEHHDPKGIKWPVSVAPFHVHLITVNHGHDGTRNAADDLYDQLAQAGISCLYDDRDERAGVKFNDADLIGNPFHLVVGERNLKNRQVEIKIRASGESVLVDISAAVNRIKELLVS